MKIGIDARMWAESGIGRYVRNLVTELTKVDDKNTYFVFCLDKDRPEIDGILAGKANWKSVGANYKWYGFAEQFLFPLKIFSKRLDLMHFTHFNVPVLTLNKFIVTIHDLTHFTFMMKKATTRNVIIFALKQRAYAFVFNLAIMRSQKVIVVSEYVKGEIFARYKVQTEKIVVIYEAAEKPIPISTNESNAYMEECGIKNKFFLFVGNAHPHKNIEFLLESFKEFLQGHKDFQLVLAGKENYFWKRLLSEAKSKKQLENVKYLGYVTDRQLAILYSKARAYIFPSLSEGFGLPVLEAMTYGCPVLCAKSTSLPEIGKDAALYFNPLMQGTLVDLMNGIDDEDVREERIRTGFEVVNEFDWKKTAESTMRIYDDIVRI